MKSLAILTGAGISAESGLKTFRGPDGLWEGHPVEEVASIEGYLRNPTLVQTFYNQRRKQLIEEGITPNLAHVALAELQRQWEGDFMLITQNVDNLHEKAGSTDVLHIHGELLKARCENSGTVLPWTKNIEPESPCPECSQKKCLRPHIVWFGEMPFYMDEIFERLRSCTHFAAIGTSGLVYPAAGFVEVVSLDARKFEINTDNTPQSNNFDEYFTGPASEQVPLFVEKILGDQKN